MSRKHIGYGCGFCLISFTLTEAPDGICPKCGMAMTKSFTLTEEELSALEETMNE